MSALCGVGRHTLIMLLWLSLAAATGCSSGGAGGGTDSGTVHTPPAQPEAPADDPAAGGGPDGDAEPPPGDPGAGAQPPDAPEPSDPQDPTETGEPAVPTVPDAPAQEPIPDTATPPTQGDNGAPADVSRLLLAPDHAILAPNSRLRLRPVLEDVAGGLISGRGAAPVVVTWRSSQPEVVSVNATGQVDAHASSGVAVITATALHAGRTVSAQATVVVDPGASMGAVSPATLRLGLAVQETRSVAYTVADANGTLLDGGCAGEASAHVANARVSAQIAGDGVVLTGVEPGVSLVSVDCGGQRSPAVLVEVYAPSPWRTLTGVLSRVLDVVAHGPDHVRVLGVDDAGQLVYLEYAGQWQSRVLDAADPKAGVIGASTAGQGSYACAVDAVELACWNVAVAGPERIVVDTVGSDTVESDAALAAAVAPAGQVYVAYRNGVEGSLKLATADAASGGWNLQTVMRPAPSTFRMAVAGDGVPRFALQRDGEFYFGAPGGPGFWRFEGGAEAGVVTSVAALAIHDNGVFSLFNDDTGPSLAVKAEGAWSRRSLPAGLAAAVTGVSDADGGLAILSRSAAGDRLWVTGRGAAAPSAADDLALDGGGWLKVQQGAHGAVIALGYDASAGALQYYRHPPEPAYYPSETAVQSMANTQVAEPLPPAPLLLGASSAGSRNSVAWSRVADAFSYNVYWSTSGQVSLQSNQVTGLDQALYEHQAAAGVPYHYAVTAVTPLGESGLSAVMSAVSRLEPPADVFVNAWGQENRVTWSAVEGAEYYTLYWNIGGDPGPAHNVVTTDTSSFVHQGLDPAVTYYYSVAANDGGEGAVSLPVHAPPAPTGLTATSRYADGTLELDWRPVAGALAYNVYFTTSPGVAKDNSSLLQGVQAPFVHGGLSDATTYYYAVAAVTAGGESVLSAQASAAARLPSGPVVWTAATPISTPRVDLSVTAVGSQLFAVGGSDGDRMLSTVEMRNPVTGVWQPAGDMQHPRRSLVTAGVGGRLYVIGGWDGSATVSTVELYDPASGSWSLGRELPSRRSEAAGAVVGNEIYVMGGWNGQALATVEILDTTTGAWRTGPSLPTARNKLAAAVVNGKIYTIGGWSDRRASGAVEIFDPVTRTWSRGASMPTPRRNLALAVLHGRIYAIGGWDGSRVMTTVEVYDPTTDTWKSEAPMPTGRNGLSATVLDGRIYAVGGWDGSRYLTTVEVLSIFQ